jgi:hypothetical protein
MAEVRIEDCLRIDSRHKPNLLKPSWFSVARAVPNVTSVFGDPQNMSQEKYSYIFQACTAFKTKRNMHLI